MKEHEKITKEEAGYKGAEARIEKYSKEELSEQAKKSANTIEQKPMFCKVKSWKRKKSSPKKSSMPGLSNGYTQ